MRRIISLAGVALVLGAGVAVGDAAAASPQASCNGVLVSSLAGQSGVVAALTREFHAATKAEGVPPGFFDVAGGHEHAGGVDECLAALGA
jgi:hypothetical protein